MELGSDRISLMGLHWWDCIDGVVLTEFYYGDWLALFEVIGLFRVFGLIELFGLDWFGLIGLIGRLITSSAIVRSLTQSIRSPEPWTANSQVISPYTAWLVLLCFASVCVVACTLLPDAFVAYLQSRRVSSAVWSAEWLGVELLAAASPMYRNGQSSVTDTRRGQSINFKELRTLQVSNNSIAAILMLCGAREASIARRAQS